MPSGSLKSSYFLVPALFLLFLGSGNILVGTFKARQYQEVYDELIVLQPARDTAISSALARIQAVNKSPDRHHQRQTEANERRNLYRLVVFGGKLFVYFGLFLFCIGATLRYAQSLQLTRRTN